MAMESKYALDHVLERCWKEDAFKDITMKSSDGVKVPATRVVLAARSPILHQMLLADKQETEFLIPMDGDVLKTVVEYCYTDKPDLLDWKAKTVPDDTFIPTLFRLQAAAEDFALPGLAKSIADCVTGYLEKFPTLVFGAYEAWSKSASANSKDLGEVLMDQIRVVDISKLKMKSVSSLSSGTLEQILKDKKMQATELDLFKLIKLWVGSSQEKKVEAKQLVKLVKLEDIAPTILSTEIASSGLVDPEQMMEAYKTQALAAATQQPVKFERRRYSVAPMWRNTMTELSSPDKALKKWSSDQLDVPPINSGKHQWTLEYASVEPGEMMFSWLGITSTAVPLIPNKPLDEQKACWAVNDKCRGMYEGSTAFMEFDDLVEGNRVIFTLDLTPDQEDRGTLSIQVMSGNAIKDLGKFTNLLDHLEAFPEAGFVPAMSVRDDCCVLRADSVPQPI